MMIKCPKCESRIDAAQVNVANNIAYCHKCSEGFLLNELIDEDFRAPTDSNPEGTWHYETHNSKVIGVTTRSIGAIFLVPFTGIWAGGSLSSIYGSQFTTGKFDLMQALVGIPFLLGSIFLISYSLMLVAGKIEIEISDRVKLFIGVGALGWTRSFDLNEVQSVYAETSKGSNLPFTNSDTIIIKADKKYKLIPSLKEDRHEFVLKTLRYEFKKQINSAIRNRK